VEDVQKIFQEFVTVLFVELWIVLELKIDNKVDQNMELVNQ
jgi:hypothetical protein